MSDEVAVRTPGGEIYSMAEWRRLLAELTRVSDVRRAHNVAETYRRYADNEETQWRAAQAKIWAAFRGGEILAALERDRHAGPGRGRKRPATASAGLSEYRQAIDEAGMSERLAEYWQDVYRLGEQRVEKKIDEAEPEATLRGVLRVRKDAAADEMRETNRRLVAGTLGPEWIPGPHQTIVIDPPWDWGDEGDQNQLGRARPRYATMPIDKLAALPVVDLAATDAHLYLWVTNRSLPKAFQLIDAWDFRYITCLTWIKPSYGMGNYFRGATEHVLFGVRGSLPLLRRNEPTYFQAARGKRGHSSKPSEFYELVERCSPGPWLEMFAGPDARNGWLHWGTEHER